MDMIDEVRSKDKQLSWEDPESVASHVCRRASTNVAKYEDNSGREVQYSIQVNDMHDTDMLQALRTLSKIVKSLSTVPRRLF